MYNLSRRNRQYRVVFLFICLLCYSIGRSFAATAMGNATCLSATPLDAVLGAQTCVDGSTIDGLVGRNSTTDDGCMSSPFETVWFIISPEDKAYFNISISSNDITVPVVSIYQGDCGNLKFVDCNAGYGRSSTLNGIDVTAGENYIIAVSSLDGTVGDFELCYEFQEDTNVCNRNSILTVVSTSNNSPLSGPYEKGEQVSFCYTIPGYENVGCNYLQAITPLFGNGWDAASFSVTGEPSVVDQPLVTQGNTTFTTADPICEGDPAGRWQWRSGDLLYNLNSENTLGLVHEDPVPAGWVFINSFDPSCFEFTNACCINPTNDPNLGYGDDDYPVCGNGTTQEWTVCFTLQTSQDPQPETSNCELGMKSFSDGETGAFASKDCKQDLVSYTNAAVKTCFPPQISAASNSLVVCVGEEVEFALSADRPDVRYYWFSEKTGRFSHDINDDMFRSTFSEAGTYTFNVYGTNGCESEPIVLEIEVIDNVDFDIIQSPAVACAGDDVTLSVVVDNNIIEDITIQWNENPAMTNSSIVVLASEEEMMVSVALESCSSTRSIALEIQPQQELVLISESEACLREEVTFDALATADSWTLTLQADTGEVIEINSDVPTYSTTTTFENSVYFEVVSALDHNGCEMVVTGEWAISPYDEIGISAGDDQLLGCDDEPVFLDATIASVDVTDFGVTWEHESSGILAQSQLVQPVGEEGEYYLTITNNVTGCSESDTVIVARVSLDLGVTIDQSTVSVMAGSDINLIATIGIDDSEVESVLWIHDGSVICETCLVTSATPTENTTYQVRVTSIYGCIESDFITIEALDNPTSSSLSNNIYIPNSFLPGDSGDNGTFRIYGDDNILSIDRFSVYNRYGSPVKDVHNVDADSDEATWDGFYQGNIVDSGVYLYAVQLTLVDGSTERRTGSISIIR